MNTMYRRKVQLSVFALAGIIATLALAAVLVLTPTGGPAQAQSDGNAYANPQPCGPGAATAFQPEPHEITSGHFALFDAYWNWTDEKERVGSLHTNLCPPLFEETITTQGRQKVTVTDRLVSHIDVDEAIFHVLDKYKADVVATNAEATSGQLSLEEYPDVRKALGLAENDPVPEDTEVWWLQLDDPDTNAKDEASDLRIGFSTALLDEKYWRSSGDSTPKPMRYMFELERYPGEDTKSTRHFLAYNAPKLNNVTQEDAVWNSSRPDVDDVIMDPGKYRHLQWIFTKGGTYQISAHLQGFVRSTKPAGAGSDWKAVSTNEDETSEVKTYVFQIGTPLVEMEPPVFGVAITTSEETSNNTKVSKVLPVFESEAETLYYSLEGEGFRDFKLIPSKNPHSVEIAVARQEMLDFETMPSYELTLNVSDRVDHENNTDLTIDDKLAVRIKLTDVPEIPWVTLGATNPNPAPGEETTIRAILGDGILGPNAVTRWRVREKGGEWITHAPDDPEWTYTDRSATAVTKEYMLDVTIDDGTSTTFYGNNTSVTWGSPSSNN